MRTPLDLPVVDHHAHLSPHGEGVEAARRFGAAGGTHLFLATQSYRATPPGTVEEYTEQFRTTTELAQRIEAEGEVVVYPVLAPYPIDLLRHAPGGELERAVQAQCDALDLAGRWVAEHRAVALGEVGRPHFPVEAPYRDASERVFRHALGVARDRGCPVVVHSDDLDAEGFRSLAELGRSAGVPPQRIIKHYARTRVPPEDRHGVTPSVLAKRDLVRVSLGDPSPWFLETDFLDDPGRPGAVLDLTTIPRRAMALAQEGPSAIERLRIPFVDAVRAVYGFTPFEDGRGAR